MAVNHHLARERRDGESRGLVDKEFTKREGLIAKSLRILIVRQHVHELVAKHGHATRLESDDARASAYVRSKRHENSAKQLLGDPQHAVVVEWAAAAQRSGGKDYVESSPFENFDGSLRR